MGTELWIDGEQHEHEDDKEISQLKQEVDFPDDDVVIYTTDGEDTRAVSDRDAVGDIPDGARVASQPQRGNIFGRSRTREHRD